MVIPVAVRLGSIPATITRVSPSGRVRNHRWDRPQFGVRRRGVWWSRRASACVGSAGLAQSSLLPRCAVGAVVAVDVAVVAAAGAEIVGPVGGCGENLGPAVGGLRLLAHRQIPSVQGRPAIVYGLGS